MYIPSGMYCPLMLCRNKTMSGAEGPNKMPRSTKEKKEKDGMIRE